MSQPQPPAEAERPVIEKGAADRHYGAKRMRRSVKHYLLGRGIAAVASICVVFLLVRELSVAEYAAYTAFAGLLVGLMILSNGGFERVIPRYFPEARIAGAEGQLRRFCLLLTGIRFLLLILILLPVVFAYGWFARSFNLPDDPALMWAFVFYAAMFGMQQHIDQCLQALLEQRAVTQGNAIDWLCKLGILGGWYFHFGTLQLSVAIWVQGCTAGLSMLFMGQRLYRHLREQSDNGANVLDRRQVTHMAFNSYLLPIAGLHATPAMSKLLAAWLLPPAMTAMVGFAQSSTEFMRRHLPARLMLGVVEPAIMARYAETRDFSQTTRLAGIVLKFNLFILIPAAAWISLSGRPLIELFTGGKYGDSAWLIGCYMLILIMESHRFILHLIANAVEESRLLLQSNLVSMIFVPVTIVACGAFQLYGLMTCLLAISFSRNFYVVRALRRRGYMYAPDWRGIARIALMGIIAAVAGNILLRIFGATATVALISLVLSGLLYLGLSLIYKSFSQIERDTINNFLGKRFFFL